MACQAHIKLSTAGTAIEMYAGCCAPGVTQKMHMVKQNTAIAPQNTTAGAHLLYRTSQPAHLAGRSQVGTVEVLSQCVGPVVAVEHPVGVHHWHQLEHKGAAQRCRAGVVPPQQEGEQAVEHVGGGCLARVHAC